VKTVKTGPQGPQEGDSLHQHRLSTSTETLYINRDSLHQHRLSTSTETLYINIDSLHQQRLSTLTETLYINRDSLHQLHVPYNSCQWAGTDWTHTR